MNNIAYCQRLSMVLPEELRLLKQFILWRLEPNKEGKPTKVPYQCSGYPASTTNPAHWSTFVYALEQMRRPDFATGIGFVFSPDDPYCGVDLDLIWRSDADEAPQWAQDILERFSETYGEASPSDTGYKIWCKAKASRCTKWKRPTPESTTAGLKPAQIEIYDRDRFFTLTGNCNRVPVITDHHQDINQIICDLDEEERNKQKTNPGSRQFQEQIGEGDRHDSLVSLAGSMVSMMKTRRVCYEAIEAALVEMNRMQCQGRYDLKHIRTIIKDARTWE